MTSPARNIARVAQAMFIVSMLILAFGFAHLFYSGGDPGSQAIDKHMPYLYAFAVTLGTAIILAIVATLLNFRARTK